MKNEFEELISALLISALNQRPEDIPQSYYDQVKGMHLYERTLKLYKIVRPLNIKPLLLKVYHYVPIIELFKKWSVGEFRSELPEQFKGITVGQFEIALFNAEFILFTDVIEIVGDFQMDLISKDIIASRDVAELTKIYRLLMQMEWTNEKLIFEPYNNSQIKSRKQDIPILQGSILKEIEFNLKKNNIQIPLGESLDPNKLNTDEVEIFKNKNKYWFKVGVFFATGEIDKILKSNNYNFAQTAKQLGNKNFRPFISESYNNTSKGNKNIFSNRQRIKEIVEYCNHENIPINENFLSKLNP
jgi:hypothetical protein